jgi:signal transduction histidine kinase
LSGLQDFQDRGLIVLGQAAVISALFVSISMQDRTRRVVISGGGTGLLLWIAGSWFGTGSSIAFLPGPFVLVVGLLARRLASTRVALAEQGQMVSGEQAQRVVLEERARIARDLHDIVAHHMSLVAVQAETAEYRLPDLPDPVRAELESIGTSARAALAQTRSLLSVLRSDDDQGRRMPQPALGQLPELVEDARRVGQVVDLHQAPELSDAGGEVRSALGLAAYRIVQESLANAARHASGAPVRVDVRVDNGELRVDVVNGLSRSGSVDSATEAIAPAEAHGIVGMRERAAAEGGSLVAGPTDDGGFAVHAELPLEVR